MLQVPEHVNWVVVFLDGFAGGVAGGVITWIAATRLQARARREGREAVVRRLLAATDGMIGHFRMARQNLHNAEAQHDLDAVRAVFQGAEYLFPSDDGDRLAAVVGGGAEQLDQQCYQRWLAAQTAAKEAAVKYGQIRSLIALASPDAELTHNVGVYRGLLHDAIIRVEEALTLTQQYAALDSRTTLTHLLHGHA